MYYKDKNLPITGSMVHSHLCLTSDQTQSYTRVFNLRQKSVQTILSFILSSKFNRYHKFCNQNLKLPSPFEFTEWNIIDSLCQNYIEWHHFYSRSLNSEDAVIMYEPMIRQLKTTVYDQVYPEKEKFLLNYNDIVNYITDRYGMDLNNSQKLFVNHQGLDYYHYVNYTVD